MHQDNCCATPAWFALCCAWLWPLSHRAPLLYLAVAPVFLGPLVACSQGAWLDAGQKGTDSAWQCSLTSPAGVD